MRKTFTLIVFVVFSLLFLAVYHFNNSTTERTISETEKIASLGKIYGFLKYYHPEVGKGKYNWDKEFIKYLPKVLATTDKQSLSSIYISWIDNLGKVEACKKCDLNGNYFTKNFDLSWSQDTHLFTTKLASKLKYIEENRILEENFYITNEPVGKIKVTNEPNYSEFEYPNEEYRLLGLFKYWNIIEYFYPYKYLTDQNWNSVLLEMIPKFRNASNKYEYQYAIKELIAKLDDTHARINFTDNRSKFLPVEISRIENKAVVSAFRNDSLANLSQLKLGDVILKINDLDIATEVINESKYVSGSNTNIKIRNSYYKILNGIDSTIKLTILRDDIVKEIEARRYNFDDYKNNNNLTKIKSKSINNNIGYIDMAYVKGEDILDIFKMFENKEAIIIDLRNYPAFIYKLFSRYINHERKDFAKVYSPYISYPGKFIFKKNLQTGSSKKAFKGKVYLLVNDKTISRSEFTAMAFQTSKNVTTIGNQTAGADGDVVVFEYMEGYKTTISGNGILYPDGFETQRRGIKIDVEVKPTIKGLLNGKDEVLEKAIELASQ
ncbi:S41 family peptidase [Maribacter sp. MAR_2009_72]|uniref:S41 family peptidase n=1 Tax=Maribacter sp. MAR_2009_72 TaxID=1250050 RepID=UPI00119C5956|nr:S41 family peptidase [Maribacter sp. MAR_2009_72]TVZ15487.1 C-terminal processing protease CtpA/Prc [Maribacter sp. MAR_2009_72]